MNIDAYSFIGLTGSLFVVIFTTIFAHNYPSFAFLGGHLVKERDAKEVVEQ